MATWVSMCIIIYIYTLRTYKRLRAPTWYYFPSTERRRVIGSSWQDQSRHSLRKDQYGEFATTSSEKGKLGDYVYKSKCTHWGEIYWVCKIVCMCFILCNAACFYFTFVVHRYQSGTTWACHSVIITASASLCLIWVSLWACTPWSTSQFSPSPCALWVLWACPQVIIYCYKVCN